MKSRLQWIVVLFTVVSTGMAMGYSCSTRYVAPVRERIVVEEPSSLSWGTPFYAVGSVISAPFVALGNALSPSYAEPVGERFYPTSTYHHAWIRPSETRLMPVGERFTTVKVIRSRPMPVGERIITVRHHYHKTMLKPVGERFRTVKIVRTRTMLEPVGERTIIRTTRMMPVLEPVGERTIIRTTRVYSSPWFCY